MRIGTVTPRQTLRLALSAALLVVVAGIIGASAVFQQVNAAAITDRSVTLSDSAGEATAVTYTFDSAALPTSTPVLSVDLEACTTSSGACTTPTGFDASSSTLASQPSGLGEATGWSVDTNDSGALRITHGAHATAPSGVVSIEWDDVVNPDADNETFFLRATTYSDGAWSSAIDSGVVAVSTAQQISLSGSVDETLTFCTGTSITGTNCATASGSAVNFGTFSSTSESTGTSVMAASTNATSGYAVTVNGATLTSGADTITALSAGGTNTNGTEQFGLNLVENTDPAIGSDPSGSGSGDAATNYDTADSFRFATGETVAEAGGATNANAFTVSYLVNIGGATEAGTYTATMTYICTATF